MHKELEDRQAPSVQYLEALSDRLERGLLRPEALSEVTDFTQSETTEVLSTFDPATGQFKSSKPLVKRDMPRDMEQLRERVKLMGTAWLMLHLHMPGNATLRGLCRDDFVDHIDYLAGERVYQYGIRAEAERKPLPPNWPLLLAYEKEIRREALRLCMRGQSLAAALKAAREDNAHRNRRFLEQLFGAAAAGRRPPPAAPTVPKRAADPAPAKVGGDGLTKNQRKAAKKRERAAAGNAAAGPPAKAPKPEDNAEVKHCWAFQRKKGCPNRNCKFSHSCAKCGRAGHGTADCRS